jgi:hypothetical protein
VPFKGGMNMMTQNAIKKIEEKIHKDGSLTEEKKTELLNLLATMNTAASKSSRAQEEYEQRMIGLRLRPKLSEMRQKKTHQHY